MILYFDYLQAIKEHNNVIDTSGGLPGAKDIGGLDSVLQFIQNDSYYPTFEDKITHLVYGVAFNHPFLDGNKRSSIALGALFLKINGYDRHVVDIFLKEMENIVLITVIKKITKDDLSEIIALLINELPYPESLQLKIIEALEYYNDDFNAF